MSLASKYRNWFSLPSPSSSALFRHLPILLMAAFIALPSHAEAWHWSLLYGWDFDSSAECMDYYAKNPPGETSVNMGNGFFRKEKFTSDQLCARIKSDEYEQLRKQQEINRVIILSCRAESVTDAQFSACVALALGGIGKN